MQFTVSQEIKRSINQQGAKKRSPYSFRNARIAQRKLNSQQLKKSGFKNRQENARKVQKVDKKAPNRPIHTTKNDENAVAKAADQASLDASQSATSKASLNQKQACDAASTAFEFDSNFQNYQDCEYESTYLQSDFKTTPAFAEQVANAKDGKPVCAGYFLRSSVAPNVRTITETQTKPFQLPQFGEKPAKMIECTALEAPKKTAVTDQGFKRPSKIAQSVEISGLASPQFGLQQISAADANKHSALPPLSEKVYREDAILENVELDVTSLKSAPPAVPKTFNKVGKASQQQQSSAKLTSFLMIKEKEFPHLFENPVVRHQRMTKFFAEQDFNSDCETVERNKVDLLKELEQTVSRYNKNEPAKFVENLKSPPSNIEAATQAAIKATPAWGSTPQPLQIFCSTPVFSGLGAFSNLAEKSAQQSTNKCGEDNQNKIQSFKRLELVIETSASDCNQMAQNPFSPVDECMESPKSGMSVQSPTISPKATDSAVDSASIAFGVMYQHRARIQRIDQFNCDTRLLREGNDQKDQTFSIQLHQCADSGSKDSLRLGFVPKTTEDAVRPTRSTSNQKLSTSH